MHAIRLIVVYSGTVLLALGLAGRFVRRISGRGRLALALLPLVLTGRAIFTGSFYGPLQVQYAGIPLSAQAGNLPKGEYPYGILSDVAILNIPWAKAVRESVKHGHLPLLNRFMLSGDVLLGAFQPMVFHPNTLIGFLLPLAQAWTFGCALNLFMAGLCTFLFLSELGVAELSAFFGSSVWALSSFLVFWNGWDIAPAFAPFPLLLLGLRRMARSERGGISIATSAMLLSLAAGHPESLLHQVAAGGSYFLWELFRARRFARPIAAALASGVLCLGLAAPALFPFLEAMPQTFESWFRREFYAHQGRSLPFVEAIRSSEAAVFPNVFGKQWNHWRPGAALPRNADDATGTFVGGLALLLAGVGMFSRREERWPIFAVGLLAFLVAVGFPGFAGPLARLPLFNIALNGRLSGIAVFCLAVLSAFGLERTVAREPSRRLVVTLFVGGVLLGVAGVALLPTARGNGVAGRAFLLSVFLTMAPVILFTLALRIRSWRPERRAAAALGLFLLFHLAELPRLYPVFPDSLFAPRIEEFGRLPEAREPYRVTGLGYTLPANQSALYELEDPRGYTSMTNMRYFKTYPLWCVAQPVWFNRVDDATRPFLSFLNVRFVVSGRGGAVPAGWKEFTRGPNCAIFENPKALPRAFAPERVIFAPDEESTLEAMKGCGDFSKVAWIAQSGSERGEHDNGRATVETRREGSDLEMAIEAQSPAWIVVSQTAWKGWSAEEDGREIPLRFANNAFLAFPVEAGRHRVRLAYKPASFRYGVGLFLLTGVAAVVAAGWRRRASRAAAP